MGETKAEMAASQIKDIRFENVARRVEIDVMIGSDHLLYHQVLREVCGTNPIDPIGRLTSLGWVCFGPTLVKEFRRNSRSHFSRTYRSEVTKRCLPHDDALRKFWELDAIELKTKRPKRLP